MAKKKFKLRIVHYAEWAFKIQYAYYRYIPIWRDVMRWDYIIGWSPELCDEDYAGDGFRSIEDVRKHHNLHKEMERRQLAEERLMRDHYNSKSGKIIK